MTTAPTRERHVLRAVLDLLQAECIFALRLNVGAMHVGDRFIRFGVRGCADIVAFPQGRPVLWLEVKAPRGKQSELQRSFQRLVESHGHVYLLVSDIGTLIEFLHQ